MRKLYVALGVVVVLTAAVWAFNASWRAAPGTGELRLIAHRGVHQTFLRDGLENDTCTAERIYPPSHMLLENTLASMEAAFASGADIVELDVHPTTDGQLAVFHDWTLDCRTEGSGPTREHDMAYLKSLDIGYGYTADSGNTFPLRGRGVGLMPELGEVFETFPQGRFLVNFKSREAREGDMLAERLMARPDWQPAVWGAYGGDEPTFRAAGLIDGLAVWSRRGLVDCLLQYMALGWAGHMPEPCRNTKVMVPVNAAPWLWGWPNLFAERLREAGSEIILLGPFAPDDPGTAGIDTLGQLGLVPEGFDGYVWTNRVELIGPALGR